MSSYFTLKYSLLISLLLAFVNKVTFNQLDDWHLEVSLFSGSDLILAYNKQGYLCIEYGSPHVLMVRRLKSGKFQITNSLIRRLKSLKF